MVRGGADPPTHVDTSPFTPRSAPKKSRERCSWPRTKLLPATCDKTQYIVSVSSKSGEFCDRKEATVSAADLQRYRRRSGCLETRCRRRIDGPNRVGGCACWHTWRIGGKKRYCCWRPHVTLESQCKLRNLRPEPRVPQNDPRALCFDKPL